MLKVLLEAGFTFNVKKCTLLRTDIKDGEINPNLSEIEALSVFSSQTSVTQLRQFKGLASYFRQFVPRS